MPREINRSVLARARALIRGSNALGEAEALQLMGAFGLPVNTGSVAGSEREALQAAARLGYPVVVKTAQPGIRHKAARQGVHLGLADAHAVAAAWRDLAARLGERVLVAPMVKPGGLELALGMVRDQQFGPLVMIGFGGTRLEALDDVVFAMPPFGEAGARRQLERLRNRALLTAERDGVQPDLGAFCRAAALFSSVVAALGDDIRELDLNPVIVFAEGCVAVDALLLASGQYNEHRKSRSTS
jgi:succinyl-CoA synthetase beta subunit